MQEGVVRSVGILLEDVRSSLHDGSFDSLGAFVEENGIPLGEASADRGVGLPWLLAAGAVLPAFDYTLKASHLFNLLDARGVVSPTERQSFIARVRELAKGCASAWEKGETQ